METVTKTEKVLHAARVTLAEYYMLQGLKQWDSDPEDGRNQINDQIRGFKLAKIFPHKELHKALWKWSSAMVKGHVLEG